LKVIEKIVLKRGISVKNDNYYFFPFDFLGKQTGAINRERESFFLLVNDGIIIIYFLTNERLTRGGCRRRREEEHKPGAMASMRRATGEPAAGRDPRGLLPTRP
jgi:hypothetical protein